MDKNQVQKLFLDRYPESNLHYLNRYLNLIYVDYSRHDVFEKHHVLPKSIWPELKNTKSNIIPLPLRVHFLCHWILVRIIPKNKEMNSALYNMTNNKKYETKNKSSKSYAEAKLLHSEKLRLKNKIEIESGTHIFQSTEFQSRNAKRLVESGKHRFTTSEYQKALQNKRIINGNHNLVGGKIQRESGLKRSSKGLLALQNTKPWKNPMANSKSIEFWKRSSEIYRIYCCNKSAKSRKLRSLSNKSLETNF